MRTTRNLVLFAVLTIFTTNVFAKRDSNDPLDKVLLQIDTIIDNFYKKHFKKHFSKREPLIKSEEFSFHILLDDDTTTTTKPPEIPHINKQQTYIHKNHIPNLFHQFQNRYGPRQPYNQFNQYDPCNTQKKVTFKDVLGQEEAIKEVWEVVKFLKNPAEFHRLGAEMPKGILLEGPPGCGKTLIARAVAGEAGCTFIYASGSQFINKYVGTGADNIRKLFEQARRQAPSIIFVDEIDAVIARKGGDGNEEYHHTVNELLSQMDGFRQEDNVIVIAATNFSQSLDKALLRPGRFDRIVKVGLPLKQGRTDIICHYAKKVLLDNSVNPDDIAKEFAQRTTAFSGAELKKLVNEAALTACREKAKTINKNHFEKAYDKITLGLINHLQRTREQLKRTAYHEAGHALIKVLTKQPIAKVSVLSRGNALGATSTKEKYESVSEYQKEELIQKIMASQGGYLAEKIALNCSRPGVSEDLKRAYEIASAMIKTFGMGAGELEGLRYSEKMSERWKSKFDQAISDLLQNCKQQAEKLITQNKSTLIKLAESILKEETLNENDIYRICNVRRIDSN
jgi:cell division protease FtsH